MAKVYYVDTNTLSYRKKRKNDKTHTVFDGGKTIKVYRLMGLLDQAMSGWGEQEIYDVMEE